jgi:subtilase family serine protease
MNQQSSIKKLESNVSNRDSIRPRMLLLLLAIIVSCSLVFEPSAAAQSATGRVIKGNTPGIVSVGKHLGREDASKKISVTLWLQLHNRALLDNFAEQLYDKNSPNYRHWLKPAELKALFAPSAEEAKTVEQFLTEHNLNVSRVGPANFSVTVEGTVADIERAFSVEIHKFSLAGETRRANINDPTIEGPAGDLVAAVYGMDDNSYKHPVHRASDVLGGKPAAKRLDAATLEAASSGGASSFFGPCFTGVATQVFSTNGGLPIATYTGNTYGAVSVDGQEGLPCGYTPQQIYTAYNLNGLYAKGFQGQGQTIVILNWTDAPTVTRDANLFNTLNNLPPLTANNFQIVHYPVFCGCLPANGALLEVDLDVEWSHAVAPAANLVVLFALSPSPADVDNATVFAITKGLGSTISGSFGGQEHLFSSTVLNQENLIAELAAVSGISTNYSTGDDGTFSSGGFGFPTIEVPAGVPFATAVGGVSLALNPDDTIAWQSGWGTNATGLVGGPTVGNFVADPPVRAGFQAGGGGGASGFFAKPKFQEGVGVPGTQRQVPDISWLADPLTGGEVVTSEGNGVFVGVIGGTSLSTPMFSGLWAIANQEAGQPLGQAAQYLYTMPAGTITDILPQQSPTNLTGTIQDSTGIHHFSAAQLVEPPVFPLVLPRGFRSFLFQNPADQEWDAISFGTDVTLKVTKGWDNVTGVGTPNGEAFADFFAPPAAAAKR